MKKESPFSKNSRQRQLESPDRIQDYVRVTSVSPFLIGLTILLLIGAFVVWGIFGTVADRVQNIIRGRSTFVCFVPEFLHQIQYIPKESLDSPLH